jgi:hypothetical protein
MQSASQVNRVPRYIEDRIRRKFPSDLGVVPGSTPVVAFGDCLRARAATLGLNPSRIEFLDRKGVLLKGQRRRLATCESLEISDLSQASRETVIRVFEECNTYFERQPYRQWFDRLEPILVACGASYYDGSGCHLDLVQWATDPVWGKLQLAIRQRLIADDKSFLANQLQSERLRLMLVNGIGVLRELLSMYRQLRLEEVAPIAGYAHRPTRLFTGRLLDRIRVVAWSTNVQGAHGVSVELRNELSRRVAALAKSP